MEKEEQGAKNEGEAAIYELGYLLVPTIPEEKVGEEVSKIKDTVEQEGFIISGESAELKSLAYTMSKELGGKKNTFTSGYFGSLIFQTEQGSIDDIKAALDKNERLLRILIIGRTKESLVPSARKPVGLRTKTAGEPERSPKTPAERAAQEKEIDKTIEELVVE